MLSASIFYNFSTTNAQTTQANRARQVASPTATPTPRPTTAPTPEEDDEVIKVDTEAVNLNIRVVDRNNRSIGNLQQQDFKVYEDNVLSRLIILLNLKFRLITLLSLTIPARFVCKSKK